MKQLTSTLAILAICILVASPYVHCYARPVGSNYRQTQLSEKTTTGVYVPGNGTPTVTPSVFAKGSKNLPIVLNFPKCSKAWDTKTFQIDSDNIALLKSKGITINDIQPLRVPDGGNDAPCLGFATITVARTAVSDKYALKILSPDDKPTLQEIEIEIRGEIGLTPGPIPPDLDAQVDVMWALVPEKIVSDNFGGNVSRRFYCVEVVIGNNSGYDLQIAAVGFKPGPVGPYASAIATMRDNIAKQEEDVAKELTRALDNCQRNPQNGFEACYSQSVNPILARLDAINQLGLAALKRQAQTGTDASQLAYQETIPVSSYPIARGTASRGEFWSMRNLTVRLLTAAGPVLTGTTPFFAVAKQLHFANLVNVITNPVTEGFDSFWPDSFIPRLQRLDDQILRDDKIISNNRQVRTRAFIPKELLRIDRKYRNDPVVVTQALGKIVLIGDEIQYRNRISVTSAPSGEVVPPPVVDPHFDNVFFQQESRTLTVTGSNLAGAIISSTDPNVTIKSEDTKSSNSSASVLVTIAPDATVRDHTIVLTTASGSVPIVLTVKTKQK